MPQRLPDPSIKFESEWEQWIASHAFVTAHESGAQPSSSGCENSSHEKRDGIDWVGVSDSKERRVELCLKPGTGLAEVRLTTHRALPNKLLVEGVGKTIFPVDESSNLTAGLNSSSKTSIGVDPNRTVRGKQNLSDEHHAKPQPLPIKFVPSSSRTLEHSSHSTDQPRPASGVVSLQQLNSDLVRSPSTATESSVTFTQSSSGVSRTSSDGWSDMPPTPPNMVSMVSLSNNSIPMKSHLSKNLNAVECPLIKRESIPTAVFSSGASIENLQMTPVAEQPKQLVSQVKVRVTKIISEETMYRPLPKSSIAPQQQPNSTVLLNHPGLLESALLGSKSKKGKELVEQKLRFKAPRWLRPGSSSQKEKEKREKALALGNARMREERERNLGRTPLQRLRLISLKGPVLDCWWEDSSKDFGKASEHLRAKDDLVDLGQCSQGELSEEGTSSLSSCDKANCAQCKIDPSRFNRSDYKVHQSGVVPFPKSPHSSCSSQPLPQAIQDQRKKINRSSTSLISKRSNRSSINYIPRRSSSIINNDDSCDGMSCRSSIKRRRSRRMPSGLSILKQGHGSRFRGLHLDLSFLLSPPEEFGTSIGEVLKKSAKKIRLRCLNFEKELLNSDPLLDELKSDLKRQQQEDAEMDQSNNHSDVVNGWINDDWERFGSLVENVMLAFLHVPLYTKGVAFHLSNEDDSLDKILNNYRKRNIPLSQFEVDLPSALQDENLLTEAVEKLNQLLPLDILSPPPPSISPEILQGLFSIMDTAEEKAVLDVLLAKTPLESISIIKQTIDILVSVWNEVSTQAGMNEESRRLTPDDLLSLLASVIVRSGIKQQHSLIHYSKLFRLNGALSPEVDWAFVSYQAAIAYLQSDPFSENDSRSIRSQALSVNSVPNSPSLGPGWTRPRPASFTPPTTSSTPINIISANSSPSGSRISLSEHIPARAPNLYHFPLSNSRQINTTSAQIRHRTRTNYGPRVSSLMSGLVSVEPSSPRLEITPASYDYTKSMDCLRGVDECSRMASQPPGKVSATRPVLAPISTADQRSSRLGLEGCFLTASVLESSNRSCSVPWETCLTSIGEVGVDSALSASSANSDLGSCNDEHPLRVPSSSRPHSGTVTELDQSLFNSSTSSGFQKSGLGTESKNFGINQPSLSRRKTVDLTFLTPRLPNYSDSNSEVDSYRGELSTFRPTKSCHSRSGSFAGAPLNALGRTAERDLRSELIIRRTQTSSSAGGGSTPGQQRQQSYHQSHQQEGSQSSSSEGWLEWGRKRLTSVTSLNLVGASLSNSYNSYSQYDGRKDLPGSASSTASRLAASVGGGGGGGGGGRGGFFKSNQSGSDSPSSNSSLINMTPAVEALTRAQNQANLQIQEDKTVNIKEESQEERVGGIIKGRARSISNGNQVGRMNLNNSSNGIELDLISR
ncbi:hypothetical protein PPACK8108_LOCUS21645 [Phakopsora pachyrhizi]|uniref:VPS9 domain-containing protein n=1 Tax=Phakopsora pachyrhizi TaxID=170000 RepID=A0AAV0BK10_PHAPC|nr:hypothetical protein PPACK8108_LOCUS21645 [Phakopsora pachyrhizi]